MSNCSTKIFVSGHCVGEVSGGIFRKHITGSKHILHSPPSIALSVESLAQAESLGAHTIEITDRDTGRVYSCTVTHFRRYSFDLCRGGYESQKALPLGRWDVAGAETITKAPEYQNETVTTVQPVQLSLI